MQAKVFSFYIPKVKTAFSEADLETLVCLFIKKKSYAVTDTEYWIARSACPGVTAMQDDREDEVNEHFVKLSRTVDRNVEYAVSRVARFYLDDADYVAVERKTLEDKAQKVKDILWSLLWSLANKARWFKVKKEKAKAEALMTEIFQYARAKDWKPEAVLPAVPPGF